jgi:hypothetical protein
MSPALEFDLLVASVRFPFSGAQRLLLELPMLTALTTAGIAWTLWTTRSAGDMSVIARAFACTLWLHVLAIGVFDVDLRVRYFAMTCPLLAVFAAVAPTAFMLRARQLRRLVAAGALAFTGVTMATTVWEQHRFTRAQVERPAPRWWGVWAPPVAQGALDDHHAPPIGPDDIVISNDELAGVWRLGRVDYWAAPDPAAELLSFVAPDGVRRGRYAASQVLQGADEVRTVVAARGARSVSVVLFETGKFGVTPADRASIAELATVQQLVSDDWTLMRWTAVR